MSYMSYTPRVANTSPLWRGDRNLPYRPALSRTPRVYGSTEGGSHGVRDNLRFPFTDPALDRLKRRRSWGLSRLCQGRVRGLLGHRASRRQRARAHDGGGPVGARRCYGRGPVMLRSGVGSAPVPGSVVSRSGVGGVPERGSVAAGPVPADHYPPARRVSERGRTR